MSIDTSCDAVVSDSGLLSEKDVRMIRRYCIYPQLAMVTIIMPLVLSALFFVCEMIGLVLHGSGEFRPMGLVVFLVLFALLLVAFCYFAIAPKMGMKGKRWKALVERLSVEQTHADYSAEMSTTAGLIVAGSILGHIDNDVSKTIGGASGLAGTAAAVSLTSKQMAEIEANARAMASVCGIDVPDIKHVIKAMIVIPILIMVVVYVIQWLM